MILGYKVYWVNRDICDPRVTRVTMMLGTLLLLGLLEFTDIRDTHY